MVDWLKARGLEGRFEAGVPERRRTVSRFPSETAKRDAGVSVFQIETGHADAPWHSGC